MRRLFVSTLLLMLLSGAGSAQDLTTRPAGPNPMPIEYRLRVLDINAIRPSEQSFSVLLEVYISWNDPRLEPDRRYKPDEVWTPSVQFANGPDVNVMLDGVRALGQGKVERGRKLRVTFNTPFEFRDFPFDQDRLWMIVQPAPMSETPLDIHPVPGGIDRLMFDAEWEVGALQAFSEGDRAKFSLRVTRHYWFYLWSFFLPPFLICVMAWAQFWVMPPNLQVTSNSVVALVAHKFAMASAMPRIAYISYADAYFLVCLSWVFWTHVATAYVMNLDEHGRKDRRDRVRRLGKWSFPILFGLVNVLLAYFFL